MNDTVIHELEVLVERCVRPVRAPFVDKKRMREDLFSHLSSTFEDEFAKSHDEMAALQRTRERFGDPAEVSRELQRTVSALRAFSNGFEKLTAQQPGESFWHLAARHQLFGSIYLVVIGTLGLAAGLDGRDPAQMLWIFATIVIVGGWTGTLMQWCTDRMGRAMKNPDRSESRRLKWRYGLLSLVIFPGMMLFDYLGLALAPGIEGFLPSRAAWITMIAVAPLGPLAAILLGPLSAERTLYQEKWAGLDLPAE